MNVKCHEMTNAMNVKCHEMTNVMKFMKYQMSWSVKCLEVSTTFGKFWHCLATFCVHTWYLSRADGPGPWRKNLSCGEISKFCTWNMWRKLKFVHMWINFKFLHMTDVEKSKISFILCTIYGILLHFTLFWWKTFFRWQFTLFCRKSILRFTHFCVEKNLAKNSARGEKMTIMRYGANIIAGFN